jgi:hypothetical protein
MSLGFKPQAEWRVDFDGDISYTNLGTGMVWGLRRFQLNEFLILNSPSRTLDS